MNFPTAIPELEADLARVLGIQDARERSIARSAAPEMERIFLSSTKRLREELERRLRAAKAENAAPAGLSTWKRRPGHASAE